FPDKRWATARTRLVSFAAFRSALAHPTIGHHWTRSSPARVAGLAHARDGRPDLVAQERVKVVADFSEFLCEHEVGRAWMRLRNDDACLHPPRPRRHHDDAVGEKDGLGKRM